MRSPISLYHRIERAMETIALGESPLETIQATAHFLAQSFADDLGILGGRIYAQDNGCYELVRTFGRVTKAPIGLRVERSYPPMALLLDVGALVMRRDDRRLDQRVEHEASRGEEYGEERLVARVLAQRALSPQAIVDAVFAEVAEFTGRATPEDDQTMMVVKRRALPG